VFCRIVDIMTFVCGIGLLVQVLTDILWTSGGFREGLMGLMLGLAPLVFMLVPQFCLAPRDKINPLS